MGPVDGSPSTQRARQPTARPCPTCGGALPVPGIATELSLARQVVQRSVDTLREMGLVVAQENPAHRRSVLIGLTKAGRALWRRVHGRELRVLADVGGDLDPKAVQACVRVMGCLQQGFAARNRGRAL